VLGVQAERRKAARASNEVSGEQGSGVEASVSFPEKKFKEWNKEKHNDEEGLPNYAIRLEAARWVYDFANEQHKRRRIEIQGSKRSSVCLQ
jgi:hypothetical protein